MNRSAVAVALLVLLGGCNAIDGAEQSTAETVTPAPVPSVETADGTTTTDRGDCVAPPPGPAPGSVPASRTEPVALPEEDGQVDGSALAALHGRTLANHSYHLRVGNSGEVWSLPDAAAFTYEGVGLGVGAPWAYAVGGRLYTLRPDNGQLVFDERQYGAGTQTRERLREVLTGERWLAAEVGPYNYSVVGTRSDNGTELRVLRDTLNRPLLRVPDARTVAQLFVNSTLAVDRHGIVREVRHVERLHYGPNTDIPNETRVATFAVDQVGTADLHRPAAFCVSNPDAMRTAVPTDGQNATLPGATTVDTPAPNASTGAQTSRPTTTPAATTTTAQDT